MLTLQFHREKAKWLKTHLKHFKAAFPQKCWLCFKAGICYCRFWSLHFNCEIVDKLRELEKLEVLLGSLPHGCAFGGGELHG
jgi:hypothetical protein